MPYALFDRDRYAASVRTRFGQLGYELDSIHDAPGGPLAAIERADAIFIGGGNTFRLIDALWRERLIEPLRRRIAEEFLPREAGRKLAVTFQSFGHKHGPPRDADLAFDVRFLPNPHWVDELRPLTGLNAAVREHVLAQPSAAPFLDSIDGLLGVVLLCLIAVVAKIALG